MRKKREEALQSTRNESSERDKERWPPELPAHTHKVDVEMS